MLVFAVKHVNSQLLNVKRINRVYTPDTRTSVFVTSPGKTQLLQEQTVLSYEGCPKTP